MGTPRGKATAFWLVLSVSGGILVGCYVSTELGRSGDPCDGDDDCAAGLRCEGGECVPCVPAPEICNGRDDDCDPSTPDGSGDDRVGQPCDGDDPDDCLGGTWECRDGELWCEDTGETREERCNGLDDDCDGEIDEPCDCATGWAREDAVSCSGSFSAVWADRYDTAYVVGAGGAIVRVRRGEAMVMTSGTEADLFGVAGDAAGTEIYAVGAGGTILWSDGHTWEPMHSVVPANLNDVYVADSYEAFAVGDNGTILHSDGPEWTQMLSGTRVRLSAVWGSDSENVYAVGEEATLLHWDGRSWSPIRLEHPDFPERPFFAVLHDVWGSGPDDVHIVGDVHVRFDGRTWTVDPSFWAIAVWGLDSSNLFALERGGRIHRWDVWQWRLYDEAPRNNYSDLAGIPEGDLIAVADECFIASRRGDDWATERPLGATETVTAVWAASDDEVYVVGFGGVAFRYDGLTLVPVDAGFNTAIYDVWGTSRDDIFAVGDAGVIRHSDGLSWHPMDSGTESSLFAVWGLRQDWVLAVGEAGEVLHWDGSVWSRWESPVEDELYDIWGTGEDDLWVVGEDGLMLHFDGRSWTERRGYAGRDIFGVWGTAADNVYFVGTWGTIMRHNGRRIASMRAGLPDHLLDIWGSGPRDIYAVGAGGTILRGDGTSWTEMTSGTGQDLMGVGGTAANNVFAVGASGVVLHLCGEGR